MCVKISIFCRKGLKRFATPNSLQNILRGNIALLRGLGADSRSLTLKEGKPLKLGPKHVPRSPAFPEPNFDPPTVPQGHKHRVIAGKESPVEFAPKARKAPQNLSSRPPAEASKDTFDKQISSETLGEGCDPRIASPPSQNKRCNQQDRMVHIGRTSLSTRISQA